MACTLAACSALAFAQDRRPDYGPDVNTATAKKIAAGVIAECAKNNWNIAVAVVDPHGALVYYERMEDTQTVSSQIAIGIWRACGVAASCSRSNC